jgi:hypothetical protein
MRNGPGDAAAAFDYSRSEPDRSISSVCGGGDDVWVAELTVTYDGGPPNFGVSIVELRGDRIARDSIYNTEALEPPEWRAQWRAEP